MSTVPSVMIAIPAYNEEASLPQLLRALQRQDFSGMKLQEIRVLSDQSTDQTDEIARSVGAPVTLVQSKKRGGKHRLLISTFAETKTDITVVLDADVVIRDRRFIQKITAPIRRGVADLTACPVTELPPHTWVEQCLSASMQLKYRVFREFQDGNTVYTCHGRARAFSHALTSHYPKAVHISGEDAFSYLWATTHGFRYRFVPSTEVWYRLPQTMADHFKQSRRFFQEKNQLVAEFGEDQLRAAYALPAHLLLRSMLKQCFTTPLAFIGYIGILMWSRLTVHRQPVQSTWKVAGSSKEVGHL
jgi:glycosyltransferase involved in cell wall biosynthesis